MIKQCVRDWMTEQLGGDEEMLQSIYDEYKQTLAAQLAALSAARAAGDATQIDRALHTIKGSAAMVGDQEISQIAANARPVASDAAALDAAQAQLTALAAQL